MTTPAVISGRRQLSQISPRAWEHPADRAALSMMRAVPGFDQLLKQFASMFGERGVRLTFQAESVRVSEKQFPRLHRIWTQTQSTLDGGERYDLFVSQSPFVAAGAFGLAKPFVLLQSGSLRLLSDAEIEFVMGHELGHVLSGHALYHTMMVLLIRFVSSRVPIAGLALTPIMLAMLEWYRKSELSSDRAGLLAVQTPNAGISTMMRLAGGGSDEEMDLNEFLLQAEEYRHNENLLDQVMKLLNTAYITHPQLVMRAAVMRDWLESGDYERILRGEYPRRDGEPPSWDEDLGAGARYYAGHAQDAAEKAGDAARRVRDSFGRGFRGRE